MERIPCRVICQLPPLRPVGIRTRTTTPYVQRLDEQGAVIIECGHGLFPGLLGSRCGVTLAQHHTPHEWFTGFARSSVMVDAMIR
jgi:hypothetical protein